MTADIIDYENLGKLNQPFFELYREEFDKVMQWGWYVLGSSVQKFEEEFAQYCTTKYCVGVANGLDALTIALSCWRFIPGDEVLVPSNTYIATILAIIHNNLKPILVEPDIVTYNIDPTKIEEKITSKTRAIIPVHLYGKLCDMDPINTLAKQYNLTVIEDCAQAHGAAYKGKKAGAFGDFWAFSFYPTKNLGALWDAGALTCQDNNLKDQISMFRNYGSKIKYYNEVVWYNSRLDELQAAFLSIKLKRLDIINEHKRSLAKIYLGLLKDNFIKPSIHADYHDVYHIFTIRHHKRDELREYLLQHNVKTEIHYPVAPNKQKAMRWILDDQLTPIAEEIHRTTLSLPISYCHTKDDIYRVIEIMNKF